jgi:hypothetical protein
MAFVHGKDAYTSLDANDISAFCNSVEMKRSADSHDTTTFGKTGHVYQGGLTDGTASIGGIYDDTASGPKAVVEPLLGTVVDLVYRPEGTGTGKPEQTCDVLVMSYEESAPVADMIQWKAELQISDAVTTADQA